MTTEITISNDKIVRAYQGGQSVSHLAKEYRCTPQSIYNHLRRYNAVRQPTRMSSKRNMEIVAQYESGMLTREIAAIHGISHQRVSVLLKRAGVIMRPQAQPGKITKDILCKFYAGATRIELDDEYGAHRVWATLKHAGIQPPLRPQPTKNRVPEEDNQFAEIMLGKGLTYREVGEMLGITGQALSEPHEKLLGAPACRLRRTS